MAYQIVIVCMWGTAAAALALIGFIGNFTGRAGGVGASSQTASISLSIFALAFAADRIVRAVERMMEKPGRSI